MRKILITLFLSVFISTPLYAQDKADANLKFYASVSAFNTELELEGANGFDIDKDTGFRIGLGKEFYKNEKGSLLAIEGRYTDYGSHKVSAKKDDVVKIGNEQGTLKVGFGVDLDLSSFGVALVSQLYLNEYVDFMANIGFHRWEADDASININGETVAFVEDASGTDLVYGIGLGFKVSDTVLIKLEYEVSDFDGDEITGGILSANFKF